ncbi:RNA polymerase sigma factor [Tissierellaceae bacterium HCP3S3_D8]
MEDIYLIKGIKERDQGTFEILMDKYLNYVFTIANNIIGDFLGVEDTEEVCMDVFVSLWNNADKIDTKYKELRPYLAAITRNMARNKLKAEGRYELPLDEEIIIIDDNKVEERIIHKEIAQTLNRFISDLDEPDREIIIRYYFYYEKVKDIAKVLDLNENTVKTKLSRSRKRLKDMIGKRRIYNEA